MNFDGIVIGGGPAGMFAAITAAQAWQKVLLLEQNDRLGKKLLITGKGRCNVTNNCTAAEVLQNVPRNGRFLYSAMDDYIVIDTGVSGGARELVVVAGAVELQSGSELFEVTGAVAAAGALTGLLQSGQEHSGEDRDDGDHDEEFDQSESTSLFHFFYLLLFFEVLYLLEN